MQTSVGGPRSPVPAHKLLQPFFNRCLRIVSKQLFGLGNIRPSNGDVARLFWKVLTDGPSPGGSLDQLDKFSQADRMRIPQIEYLESAVSGSQRGHVLGFRQYPCNYIFDVRVISSRQAVPENRQRTFGLEQCREFVNGQV